MEVGLTEVLPQKVLQAYGQFADVRTFAQGTKPVYKVRISEASKKRAKQFVTRVGLAGRYEVFKLDGYSLEVPTAAYGGAARIEWEELLDGRLVGDGLSGLAFDGFRERTGFTQDGRKFGLIGGARRLQGGNLTHGTVPFG
jgi:hypothetical protein